MSKLIFDERRQYKEHWEIAIRTDAESFIVMYYNHPHIDGYDNIKINLKNDTVGIIVHELSRIEEILKSSLLSQSLSDRIIKYMSENGGAQ